MAFFINFQLNDLKFALTDESSFDQDAVLLYDEEVKTLQGLPSNKRKLEFIGVRHLRNELNIKAPIKYTQVGKPFIDASDQFISITHCLGFFGLALSTYPIGIDIEPQDRNALRIINKFATENEKNLCSADQNNGALELWCAKEAVYKLYAIRGLSFKNEIQIHSRGNDNGVILLYGKLLRAHDSPLFEVRIQYVHSLVVALALFKAEL